MMDDPSSESIEVTATLAVGTRVEVRNRFLGTWSRGFTVAAVLGDNYLVRRLSDDWVLPATFALEELRPA
jgi:hypothetical protein